MDGTASEQVRSAGGYTWIIILNKRNITNSYFSSALDNLGWDCLAATSTWPTWDLMASPTINASGITFTNVTTTSVTVNWVNGNGSSRVLLARPDSSINGFPLDGTDYTADTDFGSGALVGTNNYVVYNGTGNIVTVTGLTPGKTYYFRVAEYNKNSVTGNNALYLLGNNPEASKVISSPLPITLSNFKAAKISDRKVKVDWQTQQEINSKFFEVERSTDGKKFFPIGKLSAMGNTASTTNYSFIDNSPVASINYYRLKETDIDAAFTYSGIVTIDYSFSGPHHFKVISNPGKNNFTIIQDGDIDFNNAEIAVRNMAGQTLIKQVLTNTGTQTISGPQLAAGVYSVTIYDGKHNYTEKVIIH